MEGSALRWTWPALMAGTAAYSEPGAALALLGWPQAGPAAVAIEHQYQHSCEFAVFRFLDLRWIAAFPEKPREAPPIPPDWRCRSQTTMYSMLTQTLPASLHQHFGMKAH